MEDSKGSGGGGGGADKPSAEPNPNPPLAAAAAATEAGHEGDAAAEAARRPFTALSQEEADLALARVLQEQERAYMLLQMNGGGGVGSDYGSSEAGSYEYGEEGEEEELEHHLRVHHHEHPVGDGDGEGEGAEGAEGSDYEEDFEEDEEVEPELDPAEFEDDEAYARALQDAEEREVAARLMALAGLSDWRAVDVEHEEHVNDPQEAWQEVDPDEYSYEELVALGEVVGTESRGLSADTLASLPSVTYKTQDVQDGNTEQCVICRVEFEEGESLIALPCKHSYHPECINQWLQINKVCPMCSAEVSTSGNKEA
ncbi:E3 ubiquitin ligase BIG BROTHER-related-like [Phragmites australis]|uniref:E3 ubiquitin ligase BIG BROTHER-related-like n=1 Tax=Phragmites australis TaxID=29695 RepID=UPI002D78EBA7|nr:E3 ubiquitin ligase BIG BROTHER-related-like [Phragmites australis]